MVTRDAATASPPVPDLMSEVFDCLPSAVLVLDPDGRVLAANRSVSGVLGPIFSQDAGSTCCRLLGCWQPGSPLEFDCLTQLALKTEGAIPETRIDLPSSAPYDAAWVTASALREGPLGVVIQLRTGIRGDRRRRSEARWMSGPRLRIRTFGGTSIESRAGSRDGDWLQQRPGQLLKYLICERGRSVMTDEIAEAIWPGDDQRGTVRHFVHVLREKLEPDRERNAPSAFVAARHRGYELDPVHVHIDAEQFEQHVRTGAAAFVSGEGAVAADSLALALDLYHGDFIAEERYAEWAFAERERLRDLAAQACRMLVEINLRSQDLEGAATYVERLATLDPFDIDVQRTLLTLCLRRGRHSEAMRRFEIVRSRFAREFGEELPFTLSELAATRNDRLRVL